MATRLLEQIPEPLLGPPVAALLKKARKARQEAEELLSEIKTGLATKAYDGLLEKVRRFVELRPQDAGAKDVFGKLAVWEETRRLAGEIRQAVSSHQEEGLIPNVKRFLELRPKDAQAQRLLARLEVEERRRLEAEERQRREAEERRRLEAEERRRREVKDLEVKDLIERIAKIEEDRKSLLRVESIGCPVPEPKLVAGLGTRCLAFLWWASVLRHRRQKSLFPDGRAGDSAGSCRLVARNRRDNGL